MILIIFAIAFFTIAWLGFLKMCDGILDYLFTCFLSMFISAVATLIFAYLCLATLVCVNPKTYQAETIATYNICSDIDTYYADNGTYYSFSYQTDKGITTKNIEADKSYIKETSDTPYIEEKYTRFENPILNFLFGVSSREYIIYITEDYRLP